MTHWDLWYKLGTPTRRALRRSKGRWGHPYQYRPRGNLVARLARETGLSQEEVYRQLLDLHKDLKQQLL